MKNRKPQTRPDVRELPMFPDMEAINRWSWILVGLLMVIGFGIRIYRVDFLSMWTDEFIIPDRAAGFLQGKSLISTHENTGILLTLVVALFYKIVGVSDFVARLVSVVFGTLAIPAVFMLGRRLFNSFVGLAAAVLTTFSLYSIYWSRVCRNYASFEFFYLVMVVVFWLGYESTRSDDTGKNWWTSRGMDVRWLLAFLVAMVASMLNHQLTFFFVFSAAFFGSIMAILEIFRRSADCWTSKYAWVLYPTVILAVLFNTPIMAEYIIKPVAGLVLHEEGILWFIPRWDIIFGVWSSPQKFRVLNIYLDVLKNDFPLIWWLSIPGFAAAIWLKRKEGLFLFALFVVPFMLMSFVFYDPAASRYLLYLYPFFALAIACFIYVLLAVAGRFVLTAGVFRRSAFQFSGMLAAVGVLIYWSPLNEIKALINVQRHGLVSKPEISNWYFSNWREACENMQDKVTKSDVVFSTMPSGTNHYLQIDSSLWFRQMHYSEYVKKYISNEPIQTNEPNATTFENLTTTIERYPRGWIFADYYFYNVMTDPRAREYVVRNLRYHFDASSDGTVQVFSWDHSKPEAPKGVFVELGKQPEAMVSQVFTLSLAKVDSSKPVTLIIDAEGIDHSREAYVGINQKHLLYLPTNTSTARGTVSVEISALHFTDGANSIQFAYNRQSGGDVRRGYAIYNVSIGQ